MAMCSSVSCFAIQAIGILFARRLLKRQYVQQPSRTDWDRAGTYNLSRRLRRTVLHNYNKPYPGLSS
jgi:hypothetical protein